MLYFIIRYLLWEGQGGGAVSTCIVVSDIFHLQIHVCQKTHVLYFIFKYIRKNIVIGERVNWRHIKSLFIHVTCYRFGNEVFPVRDMFSKAMIFKF